MQNHVHPEKEAKKIAIVEAWKHFGWRYLLLFWGVTATVITLALNNFIFGLSLLNALLWLLFFPIVAVLSLIPCFIVYTILKSRLVTYPQAQDVEKFIQFNDESFKRSFGSNFRSTAPIEEIQEAYLNMRIDFKNDVLTTLRNRTKFANYKLTLNQAKFFVQHVIPELVNHSRAQDRAQVTEHYNRGNDFFNWFLGPTMIYTSAFFKTLEDTLEDAQRQKMDLVCKKLHLQEGEELLDLGCGWGTLVCHAAKYFGANTLGVTLAQNQADHGSEQARQMDVADKVRFGVHDYRDTPRRQFDKISCLEMAEHVGIRHFQTFLQQVYGMLKDDGLFYLQIAAIRRSWTYEDLNWAMFMDKYVFPGADASTPIWWVIGELEKAGFEIHSVENVGIHYSKTIQAWYDNWMRNEQLIKESKYAEKWFRQWAWFLAWSVIIAEQGTSTCYQILMHKNKSEFDRNFYIGEQRGFDY